MTSNPRNSKPTPPTIDPAEREPVDPPGFAQPRPTTSDPIDLTATRVTATSSSTTTSDVDDLDDLDELDEPSSPPTDSPSRASTTDPNRVAAADPTAFAELIELGVLGAGLALHRTLAPGDDNDVWLADEAEAEAIARPLSRIVARRVPVTSRQASDVTDGIETAVALAGYGIRNTVALAELRAQRAGGHVIDPDGGQVVEHER